VLTFETIDNLGCPPVGEVTWVSLLAVFFAITGAEVQKYLRTENQREMLFEVLSFVRWFL
jgi:hypothetical protein